MRLDQQPLGNRTREQGFLFLKDTYSIGVVSANSEKLGEIQRYHVQLSNIPLTYEANAFFTAMAVNFYVREVFVALALLFDIVTWPLRMFAFGMMQIVEMCPETDRVFFVSSEGESVRLHVHTSGTDNMVYKDEQGCEYRLQASNTGENMWYFEKVLTEN